MKSGIFRSVSSLARVRLSVGWLAGSKLFGGARYAAPKAVERAPIGPLQWVHLHFADTPYHSFLI